MSDILIQVTLTIGIIIIFACLVVIAVITVKHFQQQKEFIQIANKENTNLKILEDRLSDIRLTNTGIDIDEMLECISNEKNIKFSMIWSGDYGTY